MAIDDNPGAILVGNEVGISGGDLAAKRIRADFQSDRIARLFLADAGDRHDRFFRAGDGPLERVLQGSGGFKTGRVPGRTTLSSDRERERRGNGQMNYRKSHCT